MEIASANICDNYIIAKHGTVPYSGNPVQKPPPYSFSPVFFIFQRNDTRLPVATL